MPLIDQVEQIEHAGGRQYYWPDETLHGTFDLVEQHPLHRYTEHLIEPFVSHSIEHSIENSIEHSMEQFDHHLMEQNRISV